MSLGLLAIPTELLQWLAYAGFQYTIQNNNFYGKQLLYMYSFGSTSTCNFYAWDSRLEIYYIIWFIQ